MKKVFVVLFALMLVAGGANAQKKGAKTVGNNPKTVANNAMTMHASSDAEKTIKLPDAEMGMDISLRDALAKRCTTRELKEEQLPKEIIASLLWSAYGFNRPEEGKRVVPSAVNVQEFDIYLFTEEGAYLYDAHDNTLTLVAKGDHRKEISKQKHFAVAPVSVVLVANYDRMTAFKTAADRDFYAAVDAGYISQNIYLFCASADLGTVACGGIDRDTIHKILGIKNGRAMLAHPVGRK